MFRLILLLLCVLLSVGCLTFDHRSMVKRGGGSPGELADYLNMKKNYCYVLESYYSILFYNDFQDYTVIIKCGGKYDLFTRISLEDDFDKDFSTNSPTKECRGKFRYFKYNGKQAFYFDLDTFFSENREFHEFIFSDGLAGFSYTPRNLSSDENSNRASWTTYAPIDTYSIVSEKSDYSHFPFSAEDK